MIIALLRCHINANYIFLNVPELLLTFRKLLSFRFLVARVDNT